MAVATTACGSPEPRSQAKLAAAPAPSSVAATPAPSPAATVDHLVSGIPAVVPVPPRARVTASALDPTGDLVGVSIHGTSELTAPELLAFYRTRLTAAGFSATSDSLLPKGAQGAAYGRTAPELLVVAVVDRGTTRSFSIGGTVHP